jgi:formate dehydrogenase
MTTLPKGMKGTREVATFCRICEPMCGLVATVEGDELVQIRPDPANPVSRGQACPKGIAMTEVQNDPDRVTQPLRRRADGSFEPVGWDEALDDISARLKRVLDENGPDSMGWYYGNPTYFSYSHFLWMKGFVDAVGTRNLYSANSQDVASRFAANALVYGSPLTIPLADVTHTDLWLIIGGNPVVSHGSLISTPRIKEELQALRDRGGTVVVVDPRLSETARENEHIGIRAGTDAWLLMSLLCVLFEEGLEDKAAIAEQVDDIAPLRDAALQLRPEETEARTGIPAATVRDLARRLAAADSAVIYGRTGAHTQDFATLISALTDALCVVTGNLDKPGGLTFGQPMVPWGKIAGLAGLGTYATKRSRIGGYPEVAGSLPSAILPEEIETPGPGQIKAFFCSAGNPVNSGPGGQSLARALGQLDLFVALDLYVTETTRHADYILPVTTFLEREDPPFIPNELATTPFAQFSEPVVPPRGEAREEWQIIEDISRRIGVVPASVPAARFLGKLGLKIPPERLLSLALRLSPEGDLFGLRRDGLNLRKLRANPSGIVLGAAVPTGGGRWRKSVSHKDRRLHFAGPELRGELERLLAAPEPDADFPLRMVGLRELRSHNSWMHNSPKLMARRPAHAARISPADAAGCGIEDGDRISLTSRSGSIETLARVTDEMTPGNIAVPHGWKHEGEWHVATAASGSNPNFLLGLGVDDRNLERISGQTVMVGVPVRVARIGAPLAEADAALAV